MSSKVVFIKIMASLHCNPSRQTKTRVVHLFIKPHVPASWFCREAKGAQSKALFCNKLLDIIVGSILMEGGSERWASASLLHSISNRGSFKFPSLFVMQAHFPSSQVMGLQIFFLLRRQLLSTEILKSFLTMKTANALPTGILAVQSSSYFFDLRNIGENRQKCKTGPLQINKTYFILNFVVCTSTLLSEHDAEPQAIQSFVFMIGAHKF